MVITAKIHNVRHTRMLQFEEMCSDEDDGVKCDWNHYEKYRAQIQDGSKE